jgi:iron complex outermembrane receptor protein
MTGATGLLSWRRFGFLLAAGVACFAATAQSQDSTSAPQERKPQQDSVSGRGTTLDPVVVTVTRGVGTSPLDAPFAMTVLRPDSTRPGQRHTALDESLSLVPGLTAVNRNNPSQDPRISIRGFGARSAFGVRGVRVLRDGMPLTLPDGQTPVDYLSLESVGRIEVIRGAAAALYGNASGGVIDLRTAAPPAARLSGEVRQWLGGDEFSRTTIKGGGISGPAYYQADASLTRSDGFRTHARQRTTSGFARAGAMLGGTEYDIEALALDMPLAENPGALTLAQFRSDPRLADQPSVNKAARKVVRQVQVGLSADRQLARDEVSGSAFIGGRSLYNPLTFAVVDVDRRTYGGSGRITHVSSPTSWANKVSAGFDVQSQNDSRRNFTNCNDNPPLVVATKTCPVVGAEEGTITLDQRELVSSAGAYVNDEVRLTDGVRVSGGLRGDNVAFEVSDRLIGGGNPDDSGRRTLRAVTPYLGLVSRLGTEQSTYANISSSFETPTATELGNHPDGTAGINQDLKPQKSTTYEVGFRGAIARAAHYDVAAFTTRVRDELLSYEVPGGSGRRYFRNAGRTTRRGAELGMAIETGPVLLNSAYSYSNFRFDRYVTDSSVFDGRRIPGIPVHRAQASITLSLKAMFAVVEAEAASGAFVDDANSARAPGYEVMHLRAGTDRLVGAARLSLVGGVQNLFDRLYSPSLSVNAARGKFFEPAPGRTLYVGMSIGHGG